MARVILSRYGSMAEACAAAVSGPLVYPGNAGLLANRRENIGDPEWMGLPYSHPRDLAAVAATLNAGWTEGAEQVRAMAEALSLQVPEPMGRRRRVRWSDDGAEYDRERAAMGHDLCYRSPRREMRRAPQSVRIVVQPGGLSNVSTRALATRGATACLLAEILTAAGYNVEILAACHAEDGDNSSIHFLELIEVKPANAPLDVAAVAATVAHPAFFRGMILANRKRVADFKHFDTRTRKIDAKMIEENAPYEGINFTLAYEEADNATDAANWIKKALKSLPTAEA